MNNVITAYRAYMRELDRMVEFITSTLENSKTAIVGDFEFWEDSTSEAKVFYMRNNATGEFCEMFELDGGILWEDMIDRIARFSD